MSTNINRTEVIVIGCGVVGLSSAIELQAQHFNVTIVARELPPNTTSNAAAAFWYPYKVFPYDRVVAWSKIALERFYKFADVKGSGVSISTLFDLHACQVEDPWWVPAVRKYRRTTKNELPQGYVDGHVVEIPVIESGVFLDYLVDKFLSLGGKIKHQPQGVEQISELAARGRLIINCTGLGARALCDDKEVYPIRGQVVRTSHPENTACILDEHGPNAISYIVPRQNDCILGGTSEIDDWDLSVNPSIANNIMLKCSQLLPELSKVKILEHKVGLRPARSEVRLELEPLSNDCAVIHNYGHGGAGFTLSWGCAEEVLSLAHSFARNG